jgi:hypothetical protein
VCLATPILSVKKKKIGSNFENLFGYNNPTQALFPAALSVLPIILISILFGIPIFDLYNEWPKAILLICFATYLYFGRRVVAHSGDGPSLGSAHNKILYVRAAGDEASVVLTTVYGINWLSKRCMGASELAFKLGAKFIFENWQRAFGILPRPRLIFVVICILGSVYFCRDEVSNALINYDLGNMAYDLVGYFSLSVILLLAVRYLTPFALIAPLLVFFMLVGTVVGAPFVVLSAILGFFIGPEMVLASFWLDIASEIVPAGRWDIVQIDTSGLQPIRELRHSLHARPEAAAAISDWMSSKFIIAEGS